MARRAAERDALSWACKLDLGAMGAGEALEPPGLRPAAEGEDPQRWQKGPLVQQAGSAHW
jgi:hypothetical protein